jgi:hypothetical protein
MKKLLGISLVILSATLGACTSKTTEFDCTGSTPTYTNNVKAILNTNCATSGCHNSTSKAKGIDLSTYATAKSESNNSRFLGSIQHSSGYDAMPQGGSKLNDSLIKVIYCWTQNGSPE